MGGSSRRLAVAVLIAASTAASRADGQAVRGGRGVRAPVVAAGRVVRVAAADTIPLAGLPVVLHRVSRTAQGPVDTVPSGPGGRFAFRVLPDTAATYLVSVRWAAIEYFSPPLAPDPVRGDTGLVIVVADTASTVPVRLRLRTLVVSAPDQGRSRLVLDWFALVNESGLTRVTGDTLRPVWAAPLPRGVDDVGPADARLSEFSPDAITFRRDSVLLWAPLSPGRRELLLQYRIPGGADDFAVPLGAGADSVHLLLEETTARVRGGGLVKVDSQSIQGRTFQRWSGAGRAGSVLDVAFAAPLATPEQALLLLTVVGTLAFAGLAVTVVRRGRGASAPEPAALADALARLDLRYAGRETEVPAGEWRAYQAERAGLKADLAHALARVRRGS